MLWRLSGARGKVASPKPQLTSPHHLQPIDFSSRGYDPSATRSAHRITVIYSVDDGRTVAEQFSTEFAQTGEPVSAYLLLDRLQPYYERAQRQLPRVVRRVEVSGEALRLDSAGLRAERAFIWLVALPHGAALLALTVELACSLEDCVKVMEDLHHRRVSFAASDASGDPEGLWEGSTSRLGDAAKMVDTMTLGPDTYQLLFVRAEEQGRLKRVDGTINTSAVSSLVYRYVDNYAHETVRVLYPPESNRGRYLAATGPYVGVTSGLQGYVENAALISALQFVGSAALLRQVRLEAFDELVRLRRLSREVGDGTRRTRRALSAAMAQRLEHLQLELSFGVEAFDRIGSLIPSLRVLDFHAALFDAANTSEEARTVGGMLGRLEQGLRSEIDTLQAEERSDDERRRSSRSVALALITAVAVPLGVVFGFFGMGTKEVRADQSFLSWASYRGIYIFLGGIIVVAVLCAVALRIKFSLEDSHERKAEDGLLRTTLALDPRPRSDMTPVKTERGR